MKENFYKFKTRYVHIFKSLPHITFNAIQYDTVCYAETLHIARQRACPWTDDLLSQ
jgi:hypothetical protein